MPNTPYLTEIDIFAFDFPPQGWAFCNGQLLPVNQNQAVFALIGTGYGGDGANNFALPNLRGQVPIHFGGAHFLTERAGSESVTISIQQLPTHLHPVNVSSTDATDSFPDPNLILGTAALDIYRDPTNLVAMEPQVMSSVGGSQPHENRQPFLALNFCIALQGIFPSRN